MMIGHGPLFFWAVLGVYGGLQALLVVSDEKPMTFTQIAGFRIYWFFTICICIY